MELILALCEVQERKLSKFHSLKLYECTLNTLEVEKGANVMRLS